MGKGITVKKVTKVTLFKWDFNKKVDTEPEQKQGGLLSVARPKLTASKSHGEAEAPKKKRAKSTVPTDASAMKGSSGKKKQSGKKKEKGKGKKAKGNRLGVSGNGTHTRRKSASPSLRNSKSVKAPSKQKRASANQLSISSKANQRKASSKSAKKGGRGHKFAKSALIGGDKAKEVQLAQQLKMSPKLGRKSKTATKNRKHKKEKEKEKEKPKRKSLTIRVDSDSEKKGKNKLG